MWCCYTAVVICYWWAGYLIHDDVIKWKIFPRNRSFVRGIQQLPGNSPHKGQWHGALMFSFICAWINGWVNKRAAGDLRRHRAPYDVIQELIRPRNYHGALGSLVTHDRWNWLWISHPVADHKAGFCPGVLKGQGICDEAPWHLIVPCLASCMPPPAHPLTTGKNSPAFEIQWLSVAAETNGWTMGMIYISWIGISSKPPRQPLYVT